MKERVVVMCLTMAFALGLGAPTAVAAPNPGTDEPFAPEEWVPVLEPAAVDRDPASGTTCEAPGSVAEFVEITGSRYDVEGAAFTKNDIGDEPIPLTQTIKESKTKKWWTNISASMKVSKELNHKYSWEYFREMVWNLEQKVGPYEVRRGETGRLSWGSLVDRFVEQTVRCSASSKTWGPIGHNYFDMVPRERHVEVTIQ